MSNLQVHNSFEPYYAGRNNDGSKWALRKKTCERSDMPGIDQTDSGPERPDTGTDAQNQKRS